MKPVTEPGPVEILVTEVVDEFMSRLQQGANPDVEEYAARHPELAQLLRELLPALQVMDQTASTAAPDGPAAAAVPGCLGDFYILRQVGQGGMGTVYEAEQISLVRRVALKVLPFASTLDAKQLQRFKNEAQAAAHLRHPNIVPVYTAGCERGVHYYAMQFIEGQSLATLIQERRRGGLRGVEAGTGGAADNAVCGAAARSTLHAAATEPSANNKEFFRTVARWGMQAAAALDHAHQYGIVHRDIKPANLLVDGMGNVWITDFGLARLRTHNGLTMTGDLLGTLRYMSPEQAQGGHNPLDHRSDIYSLGITLYEVVGLQPPFCAVDRHELLRQIGNEEPPALRRLNPAVPQELEVILLKATAKCPDERYATAQDFADDFSRFLDDAPIRARRPSLGQRLKRRLRRHKAALALAGAALVAMLLLAVVLLAATNVRIAHEEALTRQALADAQASRLSAEAHRREAEANFRKAREAVDQMLTEVAAAPLFDRPQLEPVRRALLEKALQFYQGFLKEKGDDPEVRFETGRAYARVGAICQQLGQPGPSESAYRRGLELFDTLVAEFPAVPRYRQELAQLKVDLGTALGRAFGRPGEAEPFLRRALDMQEKLAAEFSGNPACHDALAQTCHHLGYQLWDDGRLPEAEAFFRRAVRAWHQHESARVGPAQSYNSLGILLRVGGRFAEAEEAHRSARALVSPPFPHGLESACEWELARSQGHLGTVLALRQRFTEAEAALGDALALRTRFVQDSPSSRGARQELALTHLSLGWVAEISGRTKRAEAPYRAALALQEKLRADFPLLWDSSYHVGRTHAWLGQLLHELGRRAEAEQAFRAAGCAYEDALSIAPHNPNLNHHYAWLLATCPLESFRDPRRAVVLAAKAVAAQPARALYRSTLGAAHYRAGNWQAARAALERALEPPGTGTTGTAAPRFFLAMTHWQLGAKELARRSFAQGIAEAVSNNTLATRCCRAEAAALLGAP